MRCIGRRSVRRGTGEPSVRERCVHRCTRLIQLLRSSPESAMAEWWYSAPTTPVSYNPHPYVDGNPYYLENHLVPPPQAQRSQPLGLSPPTAMPPPPMSMPPPASMLYRPNPPKVDNPREIRNKAEKQRRDKLNQSIAELASMVPPVVYSTRKIDKTGVLRYTAHYLRAHQYVFDSVPEPTTFTRSSTRALLSLLNGFLLTTTYKGLIVVVSQNVNEYLGYTELDLLGKSVFTLIHEDDRELIRAQLIPRSQPLGQHGELLVPNDQEGRWRVARTLSNERRRFIVRFLKLGNRSEPSKYVTCHVEGSFRISDRALRGHNRCCQMVRRARARGENPCSSGNDVVFIGVVRPCTETFINESALEAYRMEYRTRHSIDGEIIQCEQRIALVTGYMMNEVSGVNAMNFIHRDEVRWVIIALKEMYNQNQLYGESCYRLMTKNGQFIYMRTRGRLDVDASSRAVTSFLCTNTVVDEREGKELIRMMKERFTLQAHCEPALEDSKDTSDSQTVEDPRQLEKVILNMVTTLPSADQDTMPKDSQERGSSPALKLSLIAPERERIVSAIGKIYTVMNIFPTRPFKLPKHTDEENLPPKTKEEKLEVSNLSADHDEKPASTPTYSNNDLPSFNMFFPAQNSEGEQYAELYSPSMSPDFGSVSSSSTTTSQVVVTLNGASAVDRTLPEIVFDVLSPQSSLPDVVVPSGSTAGVKRPNRFEDQENTCKKKVSVANEQRSGRVSPLLETFFDEHTLNTHIQSAIDLLDETVDPSFAELLSSNEVEEILDTTHTEAKEK